MIPGSNLKTKGNLSPIGIDQRSNLYGRGDLLRQIIFNHKQAKHAVFRPHLPAGARHKTIYPMMIDRMMCHSVASG